MLTGKGESRLSTSRCICRRPNSTTWSSYSLRSRLENSIQFTASGQDITIKEPGKETKTLDQIANAALSSERSADQSLEVRFLAGTTMRIVGFDKSAMIEAVRFKVRHHVHEREIVIDAAEVIRLIVKEVFEERQFHIRHDGQIVETTDPPTVDTQ